MAAPGEPRPLHTFEVHVWVPERRKRARHTGTMHEMLIRAIDSDRARESARHQHPGGELRKCEQACLPTVMHLRSWLTED